MPVPSQPQSSSSSSSSSSSLFSSLGSFLNSFQSSNPNPSAVAPSPSGHGSHSSDILHLYVVFEANLAQRLSTLLPLQDFACVNLPFLKQAMEVLLATKTDLRGLVPSHESVVSQAQARVMEDFLERSTKLLDVYRAVKEQISDVEGLKGMLHLVISCLTTPSPRRGGALGFSSLSRGQISRARKALEELVLTMNIPNVDVTQESPFLLRSVRTSREHADDYLIHGQPQKWRSWHGHSRSGSSGGGSVTSSSSFPIKQLQGVSSLLVPPRMSPGDADESFCAAIYAVNVISVFFLGVILAALPGYGGLYTGERGPHPRSFMWVQPLLHIQDKVHEELRRSSRKSNGYTGLWELDQIANIVRRIFDLLDNDEAPLLDKPREEIRNLVRQLQQIVEELERDLASLSGQINDVYKQTIETRMKILDVLSNWKVE